MHYLRFDRRIFNKSLAEQWQKQRGLEPSSPVQSDTSWIFKHAELPKQCCSYGVTSFECTGEVVKTDSTQVTYKAGTQSEDDPMEFILSDESVDRMGDVIRVKGWKLREFKSNPIALFGHDHSKIIGVWTKVRVEGKRLLGRLKLADEGTSDMIDTVRRLIDQRILKAVSVGFIPLEGEPRNKENPWDGYEFTKSALFEASMVSVPANPNALAIAKACSPEIADQLFVQSDSGVLIPKGGPMGRVAPFDPTPNLDAARQRAKGFLT